MKKLIIPVVFILFAFAANAQKINEAKVPEPVKKAFHKMYPDANKIKWEKDGQNFESDFETDEEQKFAVVFDASGNLVETEMPLPVSELPAKSKDYIGKNYPGQKMKEAIKITNAAGVITYETIVKGKKLLFDAQGFFVSETKK